MLTRGSFVTLALSRPLIAAMAPNFSQAFGRPIPSSNVVLGLLIRYLDFVQTGNELTDPAIARSVSDHIVDLATLTLGARGDIAEMAKRRGGKAARLNAIKSDILHALGRSDLSTELLAARHGISARYVRKLFEEEGSSFSDFVVAERINMAHRMLSDRRYGDLNIAQIAHESGFGDVSYFNRMFRRRYGATPSDLRQAARLTW